VGVPLSLPLIIMRKVEHLPQRHPCPPHIFIVLAQVVDRFSFIEGSTKYHTNTTKAIWTLQNPMSEPLVG